MFVKPGINTFEPERFGPLLKVRIPHTHALVPDSGMEIPDGLRGEMKTHWDLLLRDGDVVLVPNLPVPVVSIEKV